MVNCIRCYVKYHDHCRVPSEFKFLTLNHMVCFRHKINKDKPSFENRLAGIFDKKPTVQNTDIVLFSDPPIEPGNSRILNEYKRADNNSQLPISILQDFNIAETIALMEKQLAAAVEKSSQILEAAKGINLSDKKDMFSKNKKVGKKLSIEEIYILSQKNLIKTLNRLDEMSKHKSKIEDKNNVSEGIQTPVHEKEESKADNLLQSLKPQTLVDQSIKDDRVNASSEVKNMKSKPLCGLKRTANMLSSIFGANRARNKMLSKIQKQYEDVENYVLTEIQKEQESSKANSIAEDS